MRVSRKTLRMITFAISLISVISFFVTLNLFTSQNSNWIFAAFISLWTLALAVLSIAVEIQNKLESS